MVSLAIPVGPKPGWELEVEDLDGIKNVEDSQIFRYSLVQSRERLLSTAFPLFSTRTRVSVPLLKVMPEKHICVSLGTYELEIGVARFPDTSVFEIIYVQDPPPLLFQNIRDAPQSSQPSYSVAPAITEATLAQVNALASTNPRVAELIQLAHTNRATPDQLRELGHSVNHIVSAQTPAGPTDMVIEFRERPGQRRVIPKEHAFLEARTPENTLVVKTVLTDSYRNSEPITITLRHASPDIRRFVARWVGAEDQEPRKRKWQTLAKKRDRESGFLQHQLTGGTLHMALRRASEPKYTMESIDPTKVRRATAVRRPATVEQAPREAAANKGKDRAIETPPAAEVTEEPPTKRRKSDASAASTTPVPVSRPKTPRRKAPDLICLGCDRQGIPLHRGGKYCHACVENGIAAGSSNQGSGMIVFRL